MKRAKKVLLSIFLVMTFLTASLAVCNAHTLQTTHPDCTQCIVTSASQRGGPLPIPLPIGPHHCPHHACQHLHTPFLASSVTILPAFGYSALTVIYFPLPRLECALSIFQPPKV